MIDTNDEAIPDLSLVALLYIDTDSLCVKLQFLCRYSYVQDV